MRQRLSLQKRIEVALAALVGKPLWGATRCLNMEMFDLGDRLKVVNRLNKPVEAGEYRLHVQAPWRIVAARGVVVGSVDAHYPPSDHAGEAFDPNDDRSLCEEKVRAWLEKHRRRPVSVGSVSADELGGFRLTFSGNYALEVFPASGRTAYEHWRLLAPGGESSPHFVVQGRRALR
jgi:hypothetical protein